MHPKILNSYQRFLVKLIKFSESAGRLKTDVNFSHQYVDYDIDYAVVNDDVTTESASR